MTWISIRNFSEKKYVFQRRHSLYYCNVNKYWRDWSKYWEGKKCRIKKNRENKLQWLEVWRQMKILVFLFRDIFLKLAEVEIKLVLKKSQKKNARDQHFLHLALNLLQEEPWFQCPSYFLRCLVPTLQLHYPTLVDVIIPHHPYYESPFPGRPTKKFCPVFSPLPTCLPLKFPTSHTITGPENSPGCPQPFPHHCPAFLAIVLDTTTYSRPTLSTFAHCQQLYINISSSTWGFL